MFSTFEQQPEGSSDSELFFLLQMLCNHSYFQFPCVFDVIDVAHFVEDIMGEHEMTPAENAEAVQALMEYLEENQEIERIEADRNGYPCFAIKWDGLTYDGIQLDDTWRPCFYLPVNLPEIEIENS